MNNEEYRKKAGHLLKEVFKKKFKRFATSSTLLEKGDIFIYSSIACKKIVVVSTENKSITTLSNARIIKNYIIMLVVFMI